MWRESAYIVAFAGGEMCRMGCVCRCERYCGVNVCAVLLWEVRGYLSMKCVVGDRWAAYTRAAPTVGG